MAIEKEKTEVELLIKAEHRGAGHRALFMHTNLATGKLEDGTELKIDLTANNSALIINIGDFKTGNQYIVSIEKIIEAALEDIEKQATDRL